MFPKRSQYLLNAYATATSKWCEFMFFAHLASKKQFSVNSSLYPSSDCEILDFLTWLQRSLWFFQIFGFCNWNNMFPFFNLENYDSETSKKGLKSLVLLTFRLMSGSWEHLVLCVLSCKVLYGYFKGYGSTLCVLSLAVPYVYFHAVFVCVLSWKYPMCPSMGGLYVYFVTM